MITLNSMFEDAISEMKPTPDKSYKNFLKAMYFGGAIAALSTVGKPMHAVAMHLEIDEFINATEETLGKPE